MYTHTGILKVVELTSYYPNFIAGFAPIATPVNDLLKKDKELISKENEDAASRIFNRRCLKFLHFLISKGLSC